MRTVNAKLNHIQNWPELARQANWSTVKLAERCSVSISTLKRYFTNNMGKTPKKWLLEDRQQHAVKAIQSGFSVKEAACQLGYKYPGQFSREFRRFWGHCPTSAMSAHLYIEDK